MRQFAQFFDGQVESGQTRPPSELPEVQSTTLVAPFRASTSDDPVDILRFAAEAARRGGAALASLVEIRGGAARALGSNVAVSADGRFCGYVSGGCVEAAVAAEALQAIAEGRDRIVKYGEGSPFFDIVLPCGGGITVAIHVLQREDVLLNALDDLANREPVALKYEVGSQRLVRSTKIPLRSTWLGNEFISIYRPQTRLLISGQAGEAEAVRRLAECCGYDIQSIDPSNVRAQPKVTAIDRFTAVILMHHDLDLEASVLGEALASPAFYIGALGSAKTHRRRVERLRSQGIPSESFNRIKAPIGIFGPTRDTMSLALSILAEVAARRLEVFG